MKRPPCVCSYDEAGAAAEQVIATLGCPRERNRRTWAAFCRFNDPEDIIHLAYEYASYGRQGEVTNRVTAFQARLNKEYPDTVAYLVARKALRKGGEK